MDDERNKVPITNILARSTSLGGTSDSKVSPDQALRFHFLHFRGMSHVRRLRLHGYGNEYESSGAIKAGDNQFPKCNFYSTQP